jgi:hypothetical protein
VGYKKFGGFFSQKIRNLVEVTLGKKYFPIFPPKRMTKLVEKKFTASSFIHLMLVNLYFIGHFFAKK